ncbi:hypothetical protein [Nannocystis punicea]|uniref:Lipoprotein n=1 Tax=Nannocystis punicea TaxID=2995304 RepID=A0ABY7H2C5_9BACT|nr:hypothetical protein [Nannocystis poenicansa]WAS93250.1 hypothetical protein O0S08_44385 [Nannocystis poenicansa]
MKYLLTIHWRNAALIAAIGSGCAEDGKSSEFAEQFPACAKYMESVSSSDLAACAQELAPACEALATQEECDGFMRLDGGFEPAGVIIQCTWTDHYLVTSLADETCSGTVSSRCLASRWPGEGGPSCNDLEWDNFRDLGDGQVAVTDVACGMLPMDYTPCVSAGRHAACDCAHQ